MCSETGRGGRKIRARSLPRGEGGTGTTRRIRIIAWRTSSKRKRSASVKHGNGYLTNNSWYWKQDEIKGRSQSRRTGIEVVPGQQLPKTDTRDCGDENYDSNDHAENLALGTMMDAT